jgi:hypothetical protein
MVGDVAAGAGSAVRRLSVRAQAARKRSPARGSRGDLGGRCSLRAHPASHKVCIFNSARIDGPGSRQDSQNTAIRQDLIGLATGDRRRRIQEARGFSGLLQPLSIHSGRRMPTTESRQRGHPVFNSTRKLSSGSSSSVTVASRYASFDLIGRRLNELVTRVLVRP